jgi:tetratricopeptide (TPR) repeat protein
LLPLIGLGAVVAGQQVWAYRHFQAARLAVEKYHNDEAREHLDACLRAWPDDAETLLLAARVARRVQAFDRADDYLGRYRRLRGEDDDLILERVLLRAARGDVEGVGRFCRTLIDQGHPDMPLVFEALTAGYVRVYRLREAETCLALWLERQPDDCQALFYRGLVRELQTRQQDAIADYRRVVELDTGHDEARQRLAGCLVDLTQASEALHHLEYLHRRRPEDPLVVVDLARCRDLLGEQAEAEKMLDDLLARQPRFAPALTQRGILAARSGQFAKAEDWLRQSSAISPGDYQTHYQLSLCLRHRDKVREAKDLEVHLKDLESDAKRLREIVMRDMPLNFHNASLHQELAMIYLRAGASQEALRWLESALREDPGHVPTHQTLALYYQRMGQRGRAVRHLELAGLAPSAPPQRGSGQPVRGPGGPAKASPP